MKKLLIATSLLMSMAFTASSSADEKLIEKIEAESASTAKLIQLVNSPEEHVRLTALKNMLASPLHSATRAIALKRAFESSDEREVSLAILDTIDRLETIGFKMDTSNVSDADVKLFTENFVMILDGATDGNWFYLDSARNKGSVQGTTITFFLKEPFADNNKPTFYCSAIATHKGKGVFGGDMICKEHQKVPFTFSFY
jgi:hypothetical protein